MRLPVLCSSHLLLLLLPGPPGTRCWSQGAHYPGLESRVPAEQPPWCAGRAGSQGQQGHKPSASRAGLFCRQPRQQGRGAAAFSDLCSLQLLLCQHRIVSFTVQINQEEKSKQLGKDRAQPASAFPQGSHMFPDVLHELVLHSAFQIFPS